MEAFRLTGKTAIVTGAGAGLGNSMAAGLAEAGARVALIDIRPDIGEIAKRMCGDGRELVGVQANLTDREDLKRGFGQCLRLLGGVDILINNAGMQVRGRAEEIDLGDWDRLMELNVTALFEMSRLAAREMMKKGYGKIINVASMLSFFGGLNCSPYAASKGAVAQLTKAFSNEWAGHGINVNAIAPGYMDTALNTTLMADQERYREITLRIPAHRWGHPEDLMGTVIYLASRASDYVSGAVIPIDGGYLGR